MTDRLQQLKLADKEACERLSKGNAISLEEAKPLFKILKSGQYFTTARRLMERVHATAPASEWEEIGQHRSLCTYKDTMLPAPDRFDAALELLKQHCMLSNTKNQETLGQAGAIYKLKWQWDGRKQHLEMSLAYYCRGAKENIYDDSGYTAINAAFVMDLLAHEELELAKHTSSKARQVSLRKNAAKKLRAKVIETLIIPPTEPQQLKQYNNNKENWWFKATLAEAYFGKGDYIEAGNYLELRHELQVPEWELEATARQLVALYNLIDNSSESKPLAHQVIVELIGSKELVPSLSYGKVGLALSGGGFRASLFHIGVLARLAELDMLRHIEVISCVSGGSIIGASYALALKKLLEGKPEVEISRCDYIKLVNDLAEYFPKGVQKNLRMRLFTNVGKAIKMAWHSFSMNYTHTHRIGELYEEYLFSAFKPEEAKTPLTMQDVFIDPKERKNQRPRDYNWQRLTKVPTLIVNATTLNTGHNWQFTPTWMGEPPKGVDADICANERLRRVYYEDAPARFKQFPLGMAVAASSCVPGLFPPMALKGLFPERIVRLVDGGVYDNQGVASLMEQGCSVFLVSDASGQMQTDRKPSDGLLSILARANDIQATRLRVSQYGEVSGRTAASQKNGLCFLHLMDGLNEPQVDWVDCQEPTQIPAEQPKTPYGIYVKCQLALARIRTDLDSFSDIEANSLMTSGYQLAEHKWSKKLQEMFPTEIGASQISWSFLDQGKEISNVPPSRRVLKWLGIGSRRFFRVFAYWIDQVPAISLKNSIYVGLSAMTAWFTWEIKKLVDHFGWRISTIALLSLLFLCYFWIRIWPIIFAVIRAGALQIYLWTIDKLFLWSGRK